jgi:hypothetical protein
MQHPFINDLSDKSLDDLTKTLTDLQGKLTWARRSMNQPLIHQMQMVIESYNIEYQKRMDEMYKKQNIEGSINISSDNPRQ